MKKQLFLSLVLGLCILVLNIPSAPAQEIGVAWVGQSAMATQVFGGFEAGLKELTPEAKLEVHPDLPSMSELSDLVSKFEKEKDGMVILRSNGATWLGKNPPSIPAFIGGCNHPGQLGAVKNMDAPEGNITGVTYFLPVKTQFEVFQAILPDMKSVFLLNEKGHPSAVIDQEGTKEVTGALGIEYQSREVSSKEEAVEVVKENVGKVSAFIIGNGALVMDNTVDILAAAGDTPVLSYTSKPVMDGALGGFVADDEKLGRLLAESVAAVLVDKKSIKDTPIKVDPNPMFYINAKTAERLELNVPYNILEVATIIK